MQFNPAQYNTEQHSGPSCSKARTHMTRPPSCSHRPSHSCLPTVRLHECHRRHSDVLRCLGAVCCASANAGRHAKLPQRGAILIILGTFPAVPAGSVPARRRPQRGQLCGAGRAGTGGCAGAPRAKPACLFMPATWCARSQLQSCPGA